MKPGVVSSRTLGSYYFEYFKNEDRIFTIITIRFDYTGNFNLLSNICSFISSEVEFDGS